MTAYRLVIGDGAASGVTEKPGSTNTGATGTLTIRSGNQYIDTPGTTLQDLDIFGRVIVRTSGVSIINCRIRGDNVTSGNQGLVDARHVSCSGLTVQDCTLVPDYPSVWYTGIIGHDYNASGCDVYNVVDAFGVYNTYTTGLANVTISGNWGHDFHVYTPDPNHSDNKTHNDGVQIQGNGGVTITGNFLDMYPGASSNTTGATSAVMINERSGQCPSVSIVDNWLSGGAATINAADADLTSTTSLTITGNRFDRAAGFKIYLTTAVTATGLPTAAGWGTDTTNGNVYDDDDTPISVYRI